MERHEHEQAQVRLVAGGQKTAAVAGCEGLVPWRRFGEELHMRGVDRPPALLGEVKGRPQDHELSVHRAVGGGEALSLDLPLAVLDVVPLPIHRELRGVLDAVVSGELKEEIRSGLAGGIAGRVLHVLQVERHRLVEAQPDRLLHPRLGMSAGEGEQGLLGCFQVRGAG